MTLLLAVGSSLGFAETAMQKVMVMDKGIKRFVYIPKTENNQSSEKYTYSYSEPQLKKGMIVKFKKHSKTSIDVFESKYGLKLKHKMRSGYYIFENVSENTDAEILNRIIADEKSVETVKPNWKLRNIPR